MNSNTFKYERLYELEKLLREKFGRAYIAADCLGIPDYRLSLILNGRKPLSNQLVELIEEKLEVSRGEFLPASYSISNEGDS